MKTYVLMHSGCFDGYGAAWVAHRALGDNAIYIPYNWNTPTPPIEDWSRVLVFDVCLPRQQLIELQARSAELLVVDHHKTAMDECGDLPYTRFDMNHSGAMLAWRYFFPSEEPPLLVKWIEDKDLWKFVYPETKPAMAAIRAYPLDFAVWDELAAAPQRLVLEGKVAVDLTDEVVKRIVSEARVSMVGGFPVPTVNATAHWSEVGAAVLAAFPAYPFSASYYDAADGNRRWQLRSRGDFDVSAIAKGYGGGGHPAAAGFVTPAPPPLA